MANQSILAAFERMWQHITAKLSEKANISHTHNDIYYTETEMDALIDSKANASHTHTVANITNLQSTLDGKAASSHGTHVSYSTTAPVMDGTASVGSASTVSRSDHRHPTDTSRVSQTSFDSHTSNTTAHITSAERVNWGTGYSHSQSAHAPSNAEKNQNAFSNIAVSGQTTVTADTTTDTITFAGSNVNITTDATNDKITFSVGDGTTSAKGVVQLTNSTSSTSTTTAATPNSVKSAYDLANQAKTAAATAQSTADSKANSSHTHTVSNITDLTATAKELNYMDGVTSSVQVQLDGKSDTSHTHKYAASNSVGGSATSAVKLDTSTAGDSNTPVYFSGGKPVACTSLDLNTSGSSASCTGNSATATKLQNARTIGLGSGATGTATSFDGTGNITIPVTDIKEAYLSWGGKFLSGSVSPISAALSTEHSANRLAYLNPAAIKIEYSNDAGSTWTDSGASNSAKINLVTTSNGISVGSNSTVTTNHRTRITLTAQDGTNGYVYTRPRKMLINVSTPHGLEVKVEAKTGASGASWTTIGTYNLTGWSGWNDIPMGISTFGGGTNQTGNYWYMRLTFANTSVNASYTTQKSSVIGLRLFGDTCWTRTSNMGETGHLYSYDASQNATFPASVTAPTFSGSGVATVSEVKTYLGI